MDRDDEGESLKNADDNEKWNAWGDCVKVSLISEWVWKNLIECLIGDLTDSRSNFLSEID